VLSKVGNFALDLPDAACSSRSRARSARARRRRSGSGASCAPRRRRAGATFYTLVTRETDEEAFAHHRQRFLTEQGYAYRIMDASEWLRPAPRPREQLN
jgi:DNA excision repair protein ERCC-3